MNKKNIYIILILSLFFFSLLNSESHAQWKQVTNIEPQYIDNYYLEVYFLPQNPNYGWICGYNGYVLRTTDGGNSWKGTTVFNGGQLESIMFVDTQVGYTSGAGKIFRSDDGGASWHDITPPDRPQYLILWGNFFLSRDFGMVVGGGCGDEQYFYRTTNGGASWDLFKGYLNNSGLTDLILYSPFGLGYAASSGRIWKTMDGGQSWSVMSVTGGEDWQEDIHVSGNSMLVPYSTGCSGGGNDGGMRFSTNNARSWKQFSTGEPMFGTFLLDETHGWGVGWNKAVYYTSDGGDTWVLKNCGIPPGKNLDDIHFINDTTGCLVGEGVYMYHIYPPIYPKIQSEGPLTFCKGDSVILSSTEDYQYYDWSTGEKTKKIVVKQPGTYYYTASNSECDSARSDVMEVNVYPNPKPLINIKDSIICAGDSTYLTAIGNFISYNWSTGDTSRIIKVKKDSTYVLDVTDSNGCHGSTSTALRVVQNPDPQINVLGKRYNCIGDTVILETEQGYSSYVWYTADSSTVIDSGSNKLTILKTGKFFVHVSNQYGCEGRSPDVSVTINVDSNRIEVLDIVNSIPYFEIDSTYFLQMSCRKLKVRNNGPDVVNLDDALMLKNIPFSLPQSQFPIIIQPNETKEVEICYSPTALGEQTDTLILNDNCAPHIVPLLSIGLANIFNSTTKCNVPIQLSTNSLANDLFDISVPIPNPVKDHFKLPFLALINSPGNLQGNSTLINQLGLVVSNGNLTILNQTQQKDKISINGEFLFDVSQLSSGVYFLIVNLNGQTFTYKVVIDI